MDDQFEREAVQFCFDKGYNITPRQAKDLVQYGYGLALEDMKKVIKVLKEEAL